MQKLAICVYSCVILSLDKTLYCSLELAVPSCANDDIEIHKGLPVFLCTCFSTAIYCVCLFNPQRRCKHGSVLFRTGRKCLAHALARWEAFNLESCWIVIET